MDQIDAMQSSHDFFHVVVRMVVELLNMANAITEGWRSVERLRVGEEKLPDWMADIDLSTGNKSIIGGQDEVHGQRTP
jgi:hypothetical protein